jgi:hypothetical protein
MCTNSWRFIAPGCKRCKSLLPMPPSRRQSKQPVFHSTPKYWVIPAEMSSHNTAMSLCVCAASLYVLIQCQSGTLFPVATVTISCFPNPPILHVVRRRTLDSAYSVIVGHCVTMRALNVVPPVVNTLLCGCYRYVSVAGEHKPRVPQDCSPPQNI